MLIKKRRNGIYSLRDGVNYIFDKWPGKKTFGVYRFLPIFFCLGALLEFSMINWHVGEVNFYRTFKKRQIEIAIEEQMNRASKHQNVVITAPTKQEEKIETAGKENQK